jgi:hypothetical protein
MQCWRLNPKPLSYTSAILVLFCFWDKGSITLPGLASILLSSCLQLLSSWNCGCSPPKSHV